MVKCTSICLHVAILFSQHCRVRIFAAVVVFYDKSILDISDYRGHLLCSRSIRFRLLRVVASLCFARLDVGLDSPRNHQVDDGSAGESMEC